MQDSAPADVRLPGPWASQPEGARIIDVRREENDLCASYQIFVGHIADTVPRRLLAAIGGVVAIVAHHKVVALGHLIRTDVVELTVRGGMEHEILHAVRQRL